MRAWLTPALLIASCGSTVTGTSGDASTRMDTAVDAEVEVVVDAPADDVPLGPCTWRVGEVHDLAAPGPDATCALSDLVATGGGAWALRACELNVGAPLARALVVDRVGADAVAMAPVRVSSAFVGPITGAFSLAVDDTLDRRGVLLPDGAGDVARVVRIDREAAPLGTSSLSQPPMSFSLGGYRRLMVNRAGYSCAAEQIRALWGASMLQADAMGNTLSAVDLGLPVLPTVRFDRLALPDRGFVMAWTEPTSMAEATLRLRRYDENGVAPTRDAHTIDMHAAIGPRVAVVQRADGLMAVWETVADTFPALRTVAVRRLGADGEPAGESIALTTLGFYGGGLDAAASNGDALVTAISGSGVLRLVVLALDASGEPRGGLIPVSMVSPPSPERAVARVVATAAGALVAFQRDDRTVSVAALTCEHRRARP